MKPRAVNAAVHRARATYDPRTRSFILPHHTPTLNTTGSGPVAQRIGLLTLPLSINYGGMLQAVSLYHHLSRSGHEVILLERSATMKRGRRTTLAVARSLPGILSLSQTLEPWTERASSGMGGLMRRVAYFSRAAALDRRALAHRPFLRAQMPRTSGPLYSSEALAAATEALELDAVVVGSDQVWRADYLPNRAVEDYFLGFATSPGIRKISYAASFGRGDWQFPEMTPRVAPLLAQFDAVSVREMSGVSICRSEFGRSDARTVLDPTLLVDPALFKAIAAPHVQRRGKLFLEYLLDPTPHTIRVRTDIAEALGPNHTFSLLTTDAGRKVRDVPSWLRDFMDADYILTDSFHGTVFAILFEKNFVSMMNRERGGDRFTSLLGQLGLMDRLLVEGDPDRARDLARTPIDYGPVREKLAALRQSSDAFLREALTRA